MKVLVGFGVVTLLIVLLIIVLPFIIDLNKYQDQYRPVIEGALNRKITLKDIRLTLFPKIGTRIADFVVQDDPTFSSGAFASLTSLDVRVNVLPLLIGRVDLDEIVLRNPVVTILKNRQGTLNVSTMNKKAEPTLDTFAAEPAPSAEGPLKILTLLAVDRFSLTGGKFNYRDLSAAKPVTYALHEVNAQLNHVHVGQTASVHLGALVQPLNLPITIDGTFGPLTDTMDIETLNLHLVGGNAKSSSASDAITGVDIPVTLPFKKPVKIRDVQVTADLKGHEGRLHNLSFQLFNGQVRGQGVVTVGSDAPPFSGKFSVQGIQLGPVMDAAGVDQVWVSGTGGAEFSVQGRGFSKPSLIRALKGTGHLVLKDGRIEGINLMQEALTLLQAMGFSQNMAKFTVFSIIDSEMEIKQGRLHLRQFRMECPGFQATATGTVGFDTTLNLKASLNLSEALSKKIAGTSPVVKVGLTDGRMKVPLAITGTTQAPSFGLDTEALKGQVQAKALEAAGGLISNVFQKGSDTLKKLFSK